jgi:hypothetical protein
MKNEKVAETGRKVKAIATFGNVFKIYHKTKSDI